MLANAGHLFFVFKKTISHKDNKKAQDPQGPEAVAPQLLINHKIESAVNFRRSLWGIWWGISIYEIKKGFSILDNPLILFW
jgi:hypothetical protein